MSARFTAYFDGACGPTNPGGIVSYGAVIFESEKRIWECSEVYSPPEGREKETTNNIAEYLGFLAVLDYFLSRNLAEESILVRGDSDLVIQQCFGTMEIKKKGRLYEALAAEAKEKLTQFSRMTGRWIPRADNSIADELSKIGLKKVG
jgi:ribonuclease HI